MKRFFSLALSALLLACGNGDREPEAAAPASENEEDAARNFIRAVLDADFAQAQRFMIVDSVNSQYLNNSERIFRERLSPQDKEAYRQATIRFHEVRQPSDSVRIVVYSNSYKKQQDSLMLVLQGGQWLVDLKYTFSGSTQPPATDSLP